MEAGYTGIIQPCALSCQVVHPPNSIQTRSSQVVMSYFCLAPRSLKQSLLTCCFLSPCSKFLGHYSHKNGNCLIQAGPRLQKNSPLLPKILNCIKSYSGVDFQDVTWLSRVISGETEACFCDGFQKIIQQSVFWWSDKTHIFFKPQCFNSILVPVIVPCVNPIDLRIKNKHWRLGIKSIHTVAKETSVNSKHTFANKFTKSFDELSSEEVFITDGRRCFFSYR